MKKILLILTLFISFVSFGQVPAPPNYQYRVVYERLRGMMPDSGLHVPRYNGTPVGVRGGVSIADGSIAMDTTNHIFYYYSGATWRSLSSSGQKFGHASGDFRAGENRYFSLAGTYTMGIDSASSILFGFDGANGFTVYDYTTGIDVFRINSVAGSRMFSQNGANEVSVNDGRGAI